MYPDDAVELAEDLRGDGFFALDGTGKLAAGFGFGGTGGGFFRSAEDEDEWMALTSVLTRNRLFERVACSTMG